MQNGQAILKLRAFLIGIMLALSSAAPALANESAQRRALDDPDRLSQSEIALGEGHISAAWLISPTQRYRHFVLARNEEAAGLRVLTSAGVDFSFNLQQDQVFEDRHPRLADIDGDGADEIVLVISSLRGGASLAIFEVSDAGISIAHQSPYIGTANRWLNPGAIADFDGDGRLEISLVQMPHLVKRLEFWEIQSGKLTRTFHADGVSTHRHSSPFIRMSATRDLDGDGLPELIVPDAGRGALLAFGIDGSSMALKSRLDLSGRADGNFLSSTDALIVPLENGEKQRISWREFELK